MIEKKQKTEMRRFRLRRLEDESGVSGTGFVAEGVKFGDGTCVIRWLTDTSSMGIYHSPVEMIHIHGHSGKTILEFIDEVEKERLGEEEKEDEEKLVIVEKPKEKQEIEIKITP